jgi:hypothetical protein
MTKHVSLRLTDELHRHLVVAANRAHRSLNGQIEWCIERQLGLIDALYAEENQRDADVTHTANRAIRDRLNQTETTGGEQ